MEEMKEAGYWLVGLDERAEKNYTEVDLKGSVGIVLGGEGEGFTNSLASAAIFSFRFPRPARCAPSTSPSPPV